MNNIFAEDIEKGRAFLPGLFKFNEEELFNQALMAINEDMIFIYNDHAPESILGDDWTYSVRRRFFLRDIKMVVNEVIIKNKDLEGLNRLAIVMQGSKTAQYFYYFNQDKDNYKNFIAGLKHYGVSVQSRKVDLSI